VRMTPSYAHVGLPVPGLVGQPAAAWRQRARVFTVGTPSVIDSPTYKSTYVSAPERCP
jgi:hypothetical protein